MSLVIVALVGLVSQPRPGQAHPDVDQARVDKAIEKGAKFLLGKADNFGEIEHPREKGIGKDELVLLTLVHADVDPSNAAFQKLLDRVLDKKLAKTYEVSLLAMALEALDRDKFRDYLANCAQWLADSQCENGQWGYGEAVDLPEVKKPPRDVPTQTGGAFVSDEEVIKIRKGAKGAGTTKATKRIIKRRKGPPAGDNSNSQYAALGVRACLRAGCEIETPVVARALKWWLDTQQPDGGWHYGNSDLPGDRSWGSMTAGATSSVIIYLYWLKKDIKRSEPVAKGMKWMADHFSVKENPNFMVPTVFHYYWLYAVERVGMLFGTEKFGIREWYPEGAKLLLDAQKGSGAWNADGGGGGPGGGLLGGSLGGEVVDTCFAILFLRRATAPLKPVASEDKKK
jgi:hypothetical protein